MKISFLSLLFLSLFSASLQAETKSAVDQVDLTIYNQDFALVREQRKMDLKEGQPWIRLEDVAAQIDPTSVSFKSLTAPDEVTILEQNYEFDLVNFGKLLDKYIGETIEIHKTNPETGEVTVKSAKLLSSGYTVQPINYGGSNFYNPSQALVEIDGKIHGSVDGTIVVPSKLGELILKPTLSIQLNNKKDGNHSVELSYMTQSIKWIADYVAIANDNDTVLDLICWVTIDNRSGAQFKDAKLKLMAGDVNVVNPPVPMLLGKASFERSRVAADQFQEKSFFEYHLYTLQRPTTIRNNEMKQIEFTEAKNVSVLKSYVYDGAANVQIYDPYNMREQQNLGIQSEKKVAVTLEFKNAEDNHLGIPLPKGRVRLYKKDTDGSQEFVGEDMIDHTPKDETVRLYVGNAFDLVGERIQTNFKVISSGHVTEESFEITLRNHKKEAVTIIVREHLYRGQEWKILETSHPFDKKDSQKMEAKVEVPADGEVEITYTVRYNY